MKACKFQTHRSENSRCQNQISHSHAKIELPLKFFDSPVIPAELAVSPSFDLADAAADDDEATAAPGSGCGGLGCGGAEVNEPKLARNRSPAKEKADDIKSV